MMYQCSSCKAYIGKLRVLYTEDKEQWICPACDRKNDIPVKENEPKEGYRSESSLEAPEHYSNGIDTFARMEANMSLEGCLAFVVGNIDKYDWRDKGCDLEDFQKIVDYAQWAIYLIKKYKK